MKLVASLIVRNELSRYLEPCVASLLTFVDEVRVLDDGSDDGTATWLGRMNEVDARVQPLYAWGADLPDGKRGGMFRENEGRARNAALQWAAEARPTHLLAVDADEFVTDGAAVRAACEADRGRGVWSLELHEVWKADAHSLWLREDGGWKAQERGVPILWRAPSPRLAKTGQWQIPDRALACGREPIAVRRLGRPLPSGSQLLHFGWACEADRAARHARYVEHDGGRFHRNAHLDSIMWDDSRVRLRRRAWPAGLDRDAILARTQAVPA